MASKAEEVRVFVKIEAIAYACVYMYMCEGGEIGKEIYGERSCRSFQIRRVLGEISQTFE